MIAITLDELLAGIRQRKAALGIVDSQEWTEAMRNSGSLRTPQKRALLARIEARAREVGVEPVPSNY